MSKPSNTYSTQVEALLFASHQPVSLKRIAKALQITESEATATLEQLSSDLSSRGIRLISGADGYELAVAPEQQGIVANEAQQTAPQLSQSSLEVLTIIAYDGPTPKSHIDEIRGTSSDSSLRALLSRDLVKTLAKSGNDGPRYDLTSLAWRSLGLTGRSELPAKPKVTNATE